MTENVKGFFTQRRKDRKGAKAGQMLQACLCVFATFAPLREPASVTFIDKDDEVTPNVGFEKEVILFDRLPRGRAGVRLR